VGGQPNVTNHLTALLDDHFVEYRAEHPEPEGDFRRPTPEMRAPADKPRKPKRREPKMSGLAGPLTVTREPQG